MFVLTKGDQKCNIGRFPVAANCSTADGDQWTVLMEASEKRKNEEKIFVKKLQEG